MAVWLAGRGLDVVAVDVSPAALAAGAELVTREQPPGRVRWVEADLDAGFPVEEGRYDVVVCQRFRDPALYPAMAAALAPGGLLAVTVLSEVGDAGGAFRAAPGELTAAFADLEVLAHGEGGGEAHLVARAPA